MTDDTAPGMWEVLLSRLVFFPRLYYTVHGILRKRADGMYRARSALRHGQMSEAFSTMVFLTLSGGLQDAYT